MTTRKSPRARAAKATKPEKKRPSRGGRKAKTSVGKDVVKTAVTRADVRVPINAADAARKDRQIREKENEIMDLDEQISPLSAQKRKLKKEIQKLARDVKTNSEEREMAVYYIKDFAHQRVQTVLAETNEVVAERTMTNDDGQADWVNESGKDGKPLADQLTPGAAAAAARSDGSAEKANDDSHPEP